MALKCIVLATAVVGGMSGGAFAATMQAVYTGTVFTPLPDPDFAPKDDLNIFGAALDPGSLVGKPASIRLVFDTATAVSETLFHLGTTFQRNAINSASSGSEGYMTVAEVVLNGVTFGLDLLAPVVAAESVVSRNVSTLDGTETWVYIQRVEANVTSLVRERAERLTIVPAFFGPNVLPIMLDEEFSTQLTGSDWVSTPFQQLMITDYNPTTLPIGAPIPQTNLFFQLGSLTVTCLADCGDEEPPAVIPLPASGFILLGAGAALAAFRRRKSRTL